MTTTRLYPIGLAVLSGVFYFTGFVGFDIWPLIFVFLVPLLLVIDQGRTRFAFLLGVVAGATANLGGYYWVIHLLREFANLNLPLAILGYVLLCIYQGASVGFVAWILRYAKDRAGVHPLLALPIAWCAVEWCYPFIFPSYIGNSLYRVPVLTQIVDLFGMLGLSAMICVVNVGVCELVTARRARKSPDRRVLTISGAVLGLSLLYGLIRIPMVEAEYQKAPTIKVAIVQTNLGARDKSARRNEFIERHQMMSRAAMSKDPDIDLVVWPESAYNRWIAKSATSVGHVTAGIPAPVIFGALTWDTGDGRRRKYNTAIATSSTGAIRHQFDKVELLVFGETIPLIDTFPQIRSWFPRSSTFERGKTFENFGVAGTELMPMICYEDIIPSFVREMWHRAGPPEMLVNITNDSWYGNTHEPLIHLVLATFRTIETRRPLIRSTNTGISAFVDPVGRITARTGQWTRETLVREVPRIEGGGGTLYMLIGDVFGWMSALAVVAFVFRARRRNRR